MISQADIIRTLVNKNCTDESIMSMALSPNCTPPRLLEKFTEAERFDLALDVSMKLGLDVLPLWKTWAIRCLKNRNFQAAREKFRHCFLRLKLPGNRISNASSGLLNDILNELSHMDEVKLSLAEEVAMIEQRRGNGNISAHINQINQHWSRPDISSRPLIFSECMYYLDEYGSIEDKIKFYVIHSLWVRAITTLIDNRNQINADKFFISEVVLYLATTGRLNDFTRALIQVDPGINLSLKYFKAVYNFCTIHRRHNLLYYIQDAIGDHVAAAENQIYNFYLKKPTRSYKELNQRLTSLVSARKNYQDYLERVRRATDEQQASDGFSESNIFSRLPVDEVEKQLKTIELQIEITRNFAINEVSGCVNGIEIVDDGDKSRPGQSSDLNDSPVTLFEASERRETFLAALVLIYFDNTCTEYFSKSGLKLANGLIDDYGLDKLKVFKTAMRIIIEDESCDILENASLLLERLREDYLANARERLLAEKRQARKVIDIPRQRKNSPTSPKALSSSPSAYVTSSTALSSSLPTSSSSLFKTLPLSTSSSRHQQQFSSKNKSQTNSPGCPQVVRTGLSATEEAKLICDEVIRDSIGNCREPDYKMELAKLLSDEAKIELYIELGKLSNAQTLAFSMRRPDYVSRIIEAAARLNQNHVKTVCQLWLAKHETNSKNSPH